MHDRMEVWVSECEVDWNYTASMKMKSEWNKNGCGQYQMVNSIETTASDEKKIWLKAFRTEHVQNGNNKNFFDGKSPRHKFSAFVSLVYLLLHFTTLIVIIFGCLYTNERASAFFLPFWLCVLFFRFSFSISCSWICFSHAIYTGNTYIYGSKSTKYVCTCAKNVSSYE